MKKGFLIILFSLVSLLVVGCEEKKDEIKIDVGYKSKGKLMLTCKEELNYPSGDKEETMIVITFDKKNEKIISGEAYDTFTFASDNTYETAKAQETTAQASYCGEGNPYGLDSDNCYLAIAREKMQLSANINVSKFLELAIGSKENEDITKKEIDEIEKFIKKTFSKTLECNTSEY